MANEKDISGVEHVDLAPSETTVTHFDKSLGIDVGQLDRFGAASKVDPREIALVRKLDRHMMVCHAVSARKLRS